MMHSDPNPEADYWLESAPVPPFDWVREATAFYIYEENGDFGISRSMIETLPTDWAMRRYINNLVFADGRALTVSDVARAEPVFDRNGKPSIQAAGPLSYRCDSPFEQWNTAFDGMVIDTRVDDQLEGTIDRNRLTRLRYDFDLTMCTPPYVQNISPQNFLSWGKGKQRDGVSVGLGLRYEQMFRGHGDIQIDGQRRTVNLVGSRIKRRSVRTDALMLRGHVWLAVGFPDGRAVGLEVRPVHHDGLEPWNEAYILQDGRMYPARAMSIPWLKELSPDNMDVSFELESEIGTTRIEGRTVLTTYPASKKDLWGLLLETGGAWFTWDGVMGLGMIERSALPT